MKCSVLVMVISLLASAMLVMYTVSKKKEMVLVTKKVSFLDIKVRVTKDVLGEYQADVDKVQKQLDDTNKAVTALNTDLEGAKAVAEKLKGEAEACEGEKKKMNDELASVEGEKNSNKSQFDKDKAAWTKEIDDLKTQVTQKSKVCAFVKKDSKEGNKLCGNPIPEAPKEDAAKPEAAKPEAAKPEAAKPEAPKGN